LLLELTLEGTMNIRFVLAAAFFGIAACATSGPDAPEPSANPETPVASSKSTAAEDQFEDVEVPRVPVATNLPPPPKVTCKRVTELGSRRSKRICRTQAEIDQTEAEAADTLEDLQKTLGLETNGVEF